jgi:phage terminase small subunit
MIDLQALGFTKEELQERVIDQIVERVLTGVYFDEEGDEGIRDSRFKQELDKRVKARIDDTINALAEKHVLPNVAQYIENLTIQQTNQWGEKTGASVTFVEYLVGRAKAYMQEEVNASGKTREEDSYGFHVKQTRITYMIHQHLHHSIETAMKDSMKLATGEIARGIHETTRHKLNEIAASLKVTVTA